MKYKKDGFTYVECVVSLSIMIIIASLMYTSLYGSINITNNNVINKKMVNDAKSTLEDKKYEISNGNLEILQDYYQVEEKDGYTISTKVEKIKNYYQCYKIDVKIVSEIKNIYLSSYVTQQ